MERLISTRTQSKEKGIGEKLAITVTFWEGDRKGAETSFSLYVL